MTRTTVMFDPHAENEAEVAFIYEFGDVAEGHYQTCEWLMSHNITVSCKTHGFVHFLMVVPCPEARAMIKMKFDVRPPPYNYITDNYNLGYLPGSTAEKSKSWKWAWVQKLCG